MKKLLITLLSFTYLTACVGVGITSNNEYIHNVSLPTVPGIYQSIPPGTSMTIIPNLISTLDYNVTTNGVTWTYDVKDIFWRGKSDICLTGNNIRPDGQMEAMYGVDCNSTESSLNFTIKPANIKVKMFWYQKLLIKSI